MIEDFLDLEILEENRIDLNTKTIMYVSFDGKQVHGKVLYMGGRLTTEKVAPNSLSGIDQVRSFLRKFKTGKDVEKYFNIKGGIKVSLEKIVQQIKDTRALAEEDIMGDGTKKPNPSTLQTRLSRQRSAKGMLPNLYSQYKSELAKRMVYILVTGEQASSTEATLLENGMLVYNADKFYNDILENIPPRMYDGHASPAAVFDVVAGHVENKAGEIDLASYPAPIYKRTYSQKIDSKEKTLDLIKKIVNVEIGTEMVGYAALEAACRVAVNDDFAGATLPVAITLNDVNLAEDLAKGLKKLSKEFYLLTVGKVPSNLKTISASSSKDVEAENITKAVEAIRKKKAKGA